MDEINQSAELRFDDSVSVSAPILPVDAITRLEITTIQNAYVRISEDNLWYSLTDLFKSSGKQVSRYLRAEGTKRFLSKLAVHLGITVDELLIVNKGGDAQNQGTWIHKRALMHGLSECSDEVKVWFFGEVGFDLLSGNDIKHSEAMQSLKSVTKSLSNPDTDLLVQQYESRIDELELLTDEMANDLVLKEKAIDRMKYDIDELKEMAQWRQENSF